MNKLLLAHYTTQDNGIQFNLQFKDRLTLISGDSGIGKTMMFKAIQRDASLDKRNEIICLDHTNFTSGHLEYVLNNAKNKVIFIDNADAILNTDKRMQISMDKNNQYIILAHHTDGFKPNIKSLTELHIKNGKGTLEYLL